MRIGYDLNLGIPNDFAQHIKSEIISYGDLTQLINDFSAQKLDAIFIPVGTLPYMKDYEIISHSLFGRGNKNTLESIFVSTRPINTKNVMNYRLGRVNKYCTTSYWAPLIYLMNFVSKDTVFKFEDTKSFQDMLNKTAQGLIDGSMVWNVILQQNKKATDKVRMVFSKSDLPTPVIVAHSDFPAETRERINTFSTADTSAFFSGFKPPDLTALRKFSATMEQAIDFYDLKI